LRSVAVVMLVPDSVPVECSLVGWVERKRNPPPASLQEAFDGFAFRLGFSAK